MTWKVKDISNEEQREITAAPLYRRVLWMGHISPCSQGQKKNGKRNILGVIWVQRRRGMDFGFFLTIGCVPEGTVALSFNWKRFHCASFFSDKPLEPPAFDKVGVFSMKWKK